MAIFLQDVTDEMLPLQGDDEPEVGNQFLAPVCMPDF